MPRPAALYNRRKWQLIGKSQRCCSANCGYPLHALTHNWTRGMQLANTPPPQSTTPGLHSVSFHQMAPPVRGNTHPITAYYSVYRPRKDERLSRPGWLVTYRNKVPPPGVKPGHVIHPGTNRARRRVTSLIRPTPLPLRHAANCNCSVTCGGIWVCEVVNVRSKKYSTAICNYQCHGLLPALQVSCTQSSDWKVSALWQAGLFAG